MATHGTLSDNDPKTQESLNKDQPKATKTGIINLILSSIGATENERPRNRFNTKQNSKGKKANLLTKL